MNNIDNEYDKIVGIIKNISPQMDDPKAAYRHILERINSKKESRLIQIIGIITGIAASFLMCLLCWNLLDPYQLRENKTAAVHQMNPENFNVRNSPNTNFSNKNCLSDKNSLSENIDYVSNHIREKQEKKIKRAQFYSQLSIHNN